MPFFSIRDFPQDRGSMHRAAVEGRLEALQAFFSIGSIGLNASIEHSNVFFSSFQFVTPFVVACGNGHLNIVTWFLTQGINQLGEIKKPCEGKKVSYSGALEAAWASKSYDVCALLISKDFFKRYLSFHSELLSVLLEADIAEVEEAILSLKKEEPPLYSNVLFKILCETNKIAQVESIVKKKWILEQDTLDQCIIISAQKGFKALMQLLLAKTTANPAYQDQKALFVALENDRDEIVLELLNDARVSVLSLDNYFLRLAVKKQKSYLNVLIDHSTTNIEALQDALTIADQSNEPSVVDILRNALSKSCTSIHSEVRWIDYYHRRMQTDLKNKTMTMAASSDLESGMVRHEAAAAKNHLDRIKEKYGSFLQEKSLGAVEYQIRYLILSRMLQNFLIQNQKNKNLDIEGCPNDEEFVIEDELGKEFLKENFNLLAVGDLNALEECIIYFNETDDIYQAAWRCYNPFYPVGEYTVELDGVPNFLGDTEKLFTAPLDSLDSIEQDILSIPEVHEGGLTLQKGSDLVREYAACVFLAIQNIPNQDLKVFNEDRFIQSLAECRRSNNTGTDEEEKAELDKTGCYPITLRELSLALSLHPTDSLHDGVFIQVQRATQSYIQSKFLDFLNFRTEDCTESSKLTLGQNIYESLCMLSLENRKELLADPTSLICNESEDGGYNGYTDYFLKIRQFFKDEYCVIEKAWEEISKNLERTIKLSDALIYLEYFLTDVGGGFVSASLGNVFLRWREQQGRDILRVSRPIRFSDETSVSESEEEDVPQKPMERKGNIKYCFV